MSGRVSASDKATFRYTLRLPTGKLLPGFYAAKYECTTATCFCSDYQAGWTFTVSPPCAVGTSTYSSRKGMGFLQSTFTETQICNALPSAKKKSTCVSAIDGVWNAPWLQVCPTLGPLAPTGGSLVYASNPTADVRYLVMPADRKLLVSCEYAGFKLLARQPQHSGYESFVRDYVRYFVSDTGPSGRILTRTGGLRDSATASLPAGSVVPLLGPIDFAYPASHNDVPPEMNLALFLRRQLASATDYASGMDRTWVASGDISFINGTSDYREGNSAYLYLADATIDSGNVSVSTRGSIAAHYCSRALPSSFCPVESNNNDEGAALIYSTHSDYYGYAILDGGVDSTTLNGIEQTNGDLMRFRRCGYAYSASSLGSSPSSVLVPVVHLPGICGALVEHQRVVDTSLLTPDLSTADTSISLICSRKLFSLTDSSEAYTTDYNGETTTAYSGSSVTVTGDFVGSGAPTTPAECACVNATRYYQYWEVLALALSVTGSGCASEGYLPCSSTSANTKCWWGACNSAIRYVSSVPTGGSCTSTKCQFWPTDGTQASSLSCSCNICMNIFCLESGGSVLGSSVSQSVSCSVTGVSKPTGSTDCCSSWSSYCRDVEERDSDQRIYVASNASYGETIAISPSACSTTNKPYAQNVLQLRLHYGGRTDAAIGVRVQSGPVFSPTSMTPTDVGMFTEQYNSSNSLSTDGILRVRSLGSALHYAFLYLQVPAVDNALKECRAQWIATTPYYDFADNYPLVTSSVSTLVVPPPMAAYTSPSLSGSASSRFTYVGSYSSSGVFTAAGSDTLATAYNKLQTGSVYGGTVQVFRFQLSSGSFTCVANASPGSGSLSAAGCVCNPGYTGDATGCTVCPAGSYCTGGSAPAVACPVGSSCEGSASSADCSSSVVCTGPCTNTSFTCQSNASAGCYATSASQCVCNPGYRLAGSNCLLCPAGYSCNGGVMTACPVGQTSSVGASVCSTDNSGGGTTGDTAVHTPWYKSLTTMSWWVFLLIVLAVLLLGGFITTVSVRAARRARRARANR